MPELRLRQNHTSVRDYYQSLRQYSLLEATHEGAVQAAFGTLLQRCAKQFEWTVIGQYEHRRAKKRALRVDGAVLDRWKLARGYWEAKDEDDDLEAEAKKKIAIGYPTDNILFQSPERAILYQNGKQVLNVSLRSDSGALVDVLKAFFRYEPPAFAEWERAVEDFGAHVPRLAGALLELIEREFRQSRRFAAAFAQFVEVCRSSINPNLSDTAVEKMLVQHLLTERIFRKVFDNPDFTRRNVIAVEIEKVIDALTGRAFSRHKFLGELDRFYVAIEKTAGGLDDYREKQHFLNSVYERFFQSFDAKVADTHGIVYTPQPIVRFMVRSVDELIQREFGRGLAEPDVHIIDPFVGTGNFLVHVMQQLPKTRLETKYENELHANEVMLLPYYIASMNLEHEYADLTGQYKTFEGICLVDTFDLGEERQRLLFTEKNTERVERQKRSPIFVILGNPPYNAWQQHENDGNKNREYPALERRVGETYAKDSVATLKNSLGDPYVKAFRWASDRIHEEGIVAFVTNNGFLDGVACDGMRKHLAADFDAIYILDLGGNVRKNPKLSGTTHNVFGIQVGVSIAFLIRRKATSSTRKADIFYARMGEAWAKEEKFRFLDQATRLDTIAWARVAPDRRHRWLTEGLRSEFEDLVPLIASRGEKGATQSIFETTSCGLKTNNDAYAYGFDRAEVTKRAKAMVQAYNAELGRWIVAGRPSDVDSFVRVEEGTIKWIRRSKRCLARGQAATFSAANIRRAIYRPFSSQFVFLDRTFNEDVYQLPRILPTEASEIENRIICTVTEQQIPFSAQVTSQIPCLHYGGRQTQCFPFYVYADDGGARRENITDWALQAFRERYDDRTISKWDIFYYVYAMLHHPTYLWSCPGSDRTQCHDAS